MGRELNALADVDLDEPYRLASVLEQELKNCPKKKRNSRLGLLFGVPISIKDNFKVKGKLDSD